MVLVLGHDSAPTAEAKEPVQLNETFFLQMKQLPDAQAKLMAVLGSFAENL